MACCQGAVRDPVRRPIWADNLNDERRLSTQDFLQDQVPGHSSATHDDSQATRMSPIRVILLILLLPPVGLAVAVWIVDDGIDRFQADPVVHEVARRAYSMAWIHRDNPIQRVLAPAARVVTVTRAPGLCTSREPRAYVPPPSSRASLVPSPSHAGREYVALIRFYSFFGYPMSDVYTTCGGSAASSIRPSNWPVDEGA